MTKLKQKVGLAALVGLSLTGALAFKMVFPHSGEGALDLVPDTAVIAGTVDLDPSPSQVLTFAQIASALKANGFSDSINGMAKQFGNGRPGLDAIWRLSKRSVSMCGFAPSNKVKEMKFAMLIPFSDPAEAEKLLKENGQIGTYGGTVCYRLSQVPAYAMIEGETLVVGQEPWVMSEMAKVPAGRATPITKAAGYQQARSREPSDATALVMISPKAARLSDTAIAENTLGWGSSSITIQSGGLAFSSHGKYHPEMPSSIAGLASVKPLRSDLLHLLPAGAYGIYAISQPGQCMATALAVEKGSKSAEAKQAIDLESSIKKSTGLDLQQDVAQGMEGDMVFGLYPSAQPTSGLDLLIVADNQNGADPAKLAGKLQTVLDHTINAAGKQRNEWVMSVPRQDGTEFKLSANLDKDISGWNKNVPTGAVKMGLLLHSKTVAWASVGGSVFIATSQPLLDQAISGYKGQPAQNLSTDGMLNSAVNAGGGDQTFAIANLARVADGLKNTTDETRMNPDFRRYFDGILGAMEHLTTPVRFEASQSADGSISSSTFIPMDYRKFIDFIRICVKPTNPKPDAPFKA